MNFSDKIKLKKNRDKQAFMLSCETVFESAMGENKGGPKIDPYAHDKKGAEIEQAIDQVTTFYKMDKIKIPPEAIGDEGEMEIVLGRTGLTKRKVTLSPKWWIRGEGPVISATEDGEIVTLLPRKFGGYRYTNPVTGEVTKIDRRTAKTIRGEGFCFYKPFPMAKMTIKDLIKHLIKSFSVFDIVFLLGMALLATLMGLVMPQVNQLIFNVIIPAGRIKDIYPLAALLSGVLLFQAVAGLFQGLWIKRIGDKAQFQSLGATWIRLLNLPTTFFKKFSSGELSSRVGALSGICQTISTSLMPSMISAAFSFIYLFQILNFAPALFVPSLIFVLISLANSLLVMFMQIKLSRRANEIAPKLNGLVYQLFSGVSKIKVAGAEVRAFSKWGNLYGKLSNIQYSPNFFLKINSAITTAISIISSIVIYYVAYKNNINSANYIAFNTSWGLFSGAIMSISGIVIQMAQMKPSFELLQPILDEQPEISENRHRVEKVTGDIAVNNLKFKYTDDGPMVLNGLNLHIRSGEYLGIVGSTGCGKSTLMRVLLGFETPLSGAVYYDGKNMDSLDLHSLRRRIGVVLQNGSLFSDSIFANLTITAPTATMDDAWAAAESAGVADDIREMPMGMQTVISEGGGGVSGGQRQRLMIARALMGDPKLLIFDEATSALDNITQAIVVETLEKMDITRIVIAHRLSTIQKCDRIVYLDSGQIVEEGTFKDLMALDGKFAELAKRQIV